MSQLHASRSMRGKYAPKPSKTRPTLLNFFLAFSAGMHVVTVRIRTANHWCAEDAEELNPKFFETLRSSDYWMQHGHKKLSKSRLSCTNNVDMHYC